MIKIFPSLISGDLMNLGQEIKRLEPEADGFHIDVMDFHFVPNLTWGPPFINAISAITERSLYIHLMVDNPENYLPRIELRKQDYFCFHLEAYGPKPDYSRIKDLIQKTKKTGTKVSLAIKPSTNIDLLNPVINNLDDVLLMSVEPGFSGQEFLPNSYERLNELAELKKVPENSFTISMDGGINLSNIKRLANAGANSFGIASAIFAEKDPVNALKKLRLEATS